MYWFMSRCHNKDILNNVIFAFKMLLLSERHKMHKPYFIFKTWLWRCHVSLMHIPSSKVLPIRLTECLKTTVYNHDTDLLYQKVFSFFHLLLLLLAVSHDP